MIPEFGHLILIVHLILSLLGGTLPLLVVYTNYRSCLLYTSPSPRDRG